MEPSITPEEFAFLTRRAGLDLTEAQKTQLLGVYPQMAAMAERLRTPPRGRDAEPAHIFTIAADSAP